MMTTMILRIAAVLAAVQGTAHGLLFVSAKPRHGPAEVALVDAMKANRFFPGGRGYWDFYFGYGLVAAGACLVEAVLFWQLATMARTQPSLVRPTLWLFVVANLAHALLVLRYFRFPIPMAFDLAIAAALGWALVVTRAA